MDLVLNAADGFMLDDIYGWIDKDFSIFSSFLLSERTSIYRQSISIFSISLIGVIILYFLLATAAYVLIYDKSMMKSPKFLPNQIRREIFLSVTSFPTTSAVTVPWFLFEVRGYSKLYHDVDEYGWGYFFFSIAWFILFTDFGIYVIHRLEHQPALYCWLHKPHHQWKISTPYASFAFHPLDGYFQSLPIHIFVYLFPMNSYAYLLAFVLVQIWTVSIHDGVYIVSNPFLNSSAHHTVHHLEFNYNYGQYFTLWDRIGGTYKRPEFEFQHNMFIDKWRKGRETQFQATNKTD